MQAHPARGEEHTDLLQGESDGSQLSDQQLMTQKPEMISGVFLGTLFIVMTFNQEVNERRVIPNTTQVH